MCNAIDRFVQETLCPIGEAAVQHIQNAHEKFIEGALWLGREIHDLTHKLLPRSVAIVAEAAIKSFPFFVVYAFLPPAAFLATFAGLVIYKMITVPRDQKVTAPEFENGTGFGMLWIGGRYIAEGLAGGGLPNVAWGVLGVAFSTIFFSRSGLLEELAKGNANAQQAQVPAPQPEPIPVAQ
jgi:hypothetical protein